MVLLSQSVIWLISKRHVNFVFRFSPFRLNASGAFLLRGDDMLCLGVRPSVHPSVSVCQKPVFYQNGVFNLNISSLNNAARKRSDCRFLLPKMVVKYQWNRPQLGAIRLSRSRPLIVVLLVVGAWRLCAQLHAERRCVCVPTLWLTAHKN